MSEGGQEEGHSEDQEERDEWEERIERSSCSKFHYALQECYWEHKDWRQCQREMAEFRRCMDEQSKLKARPSGRPNSS